MLSLYKLLYVITNFLELSYKMKFFLRIIYEKLIRYEYFIYLLLLDFQARYVIPDELESWVIETIHSSWKTYKSRTKAGHFTAYENDEMRLENRPDDIPLETFKMLLDYWNDESIQVCLYF